MKDSKNWFLNLCIHIIHYIFSDYYLHLQKYKCTLDLTPHKFDVKPKSSNQIKVNMAPMGFEPTTPGLKVQCSSQAELRSHISEKDVNTL